MRAHKGVLALVLSGRAGMGGCGPAPAWPSSGIFWKREAANTVDCIARLPPAKSCSISMSSFPHPAQERN